MTPTRPSAAIACLVLCACGGGGGGVRSSAAACVGSGARCGAVHVSVAAVNSASGAAAPTAVARAARASLSAPALGDPPTASGSILSGPPDEMRIFVKEILALPSSGTSEWISLWKSADAAGTALVLTNATMDLARALGATLHLPVGKYEQLKLTLARVAQFKGCVTGKFRAQQAVTTTITAADMLGQYQAKHVGNTYSNDPIADGAAHTFCTQRVRSELAAPTFSTGHIGSNLEFESSTVPELTEVDLERSNDSGLSPDPIRAAETQVSSQLEFTVAESAETRLTLAVDLNRQLRYFGNIRSDFNPPNPGMKTGTSYFFTTIFPDSVMLIPGDAASIQGYAVDVQVGSSEIVREWLTIIRAQDGSVVSGGVIPDDDDDLTVAKGSLDPSACRPDPATGLWKLGFRLGASGTGSFDGFVFQPAVGDAATCGLTPLPNPWASSSSYAVSYKREL